MKTASHRILLNLIAIVVYGLAFAYFRMEVSEERMFATPDAQSYQAVANWLISGTETESTRIRPILYPAVIAIPSWVAGAHGIWLLHLIFWLTSINLVYLSVRKITDRSGLAFCVGLLVIFNLSYILSTQSALTETITTFLLSVLVYYVSQNLAHIRSARFLHFILLILVFLTLIKPVYQYPMMVVILVMLPLYYRNEYIRTPRKLIFLVAVLLPLIFQVSIMKTRHGVFAVSEIGKQTMNEYFFSKGIQQSDNVSWEEGNKIANEETFSQKLNRLTKHKSIYSKLYFDNLSEGLMFFPVPVKEEAHIKHKWVLAWYTRITNALYLLLHLLFVIPLMLLLRFFYRSGQKRNFLILGALYFLFCYLVLTSGVSFYQGDRLLFPSMVVWSFIYAWVTDHFYRRYFQQSSAQNQ